MRPLVICCSQRFKLELEVFIQFLEKRGVLVFAPNFAYHRRSFIRKSEQQRLRSQGYRNRIPGMVYAHWDKLDEAKGLGAVCLIFNPRPAGGQGKKFGYIGFNTTLELGYCKAIKLPLIYLRPHHEECAMAIVHYTDKKRIFILKYPKADPMDFDAVWNLWLRRWLNGN